MTTLLSVLTFLAGFALVITPWLFHFTTDHAAFSDVVIGGLVVMLLGILLTVEASLTGRVR
jgi:hypothetical protein